MATFNEFQSFVTALSAGTHVGALNASTDVLKVYLTNNTPNASAHSVLSDLSGITEENGYAPGNVSNTALTSGGVINVSGVNHTWLASGGSFGPHRYVVLYNSTAANGPLIGYWDNGSSATTTDGNSFRANFGSPIFSVSYVTSVVANEPLWTTQPTPPDATEDDSYNYDVSGFVSNDPHTWSLGGSWPTGLVISDGLASAGGGVISGTPTTVGVHSGLSIVATNDNGSTSSDPVFSITISSLLTAPQIVTEPTDRVIIV